MVFETEMWMNNDRRILVCRVVSDEFTLIVHSYVFVLL